MAIQPGFRSIEAKLLLGSATALILLGLVGIGAYRSLQSYILATHRITHTYRVLQAVEEVLDASRSIESAQRSLLLTGDQSYSFPVPSDRERLSRALEKLQEL